MPGLFGILAKHPDVPEERLRILGRRMAAALVTTPWLTTEPWNAPQFSGGRVHLGLANPSPQPLISTDGALAAWFDGQLYGANGASGVTPSADTVAGLVADCGAALAGADGVFAIAAFDADAGVLTLATDRLGFRPLYWTETADWFAYACEVKALLAILDSLPRVDQVSLRQFFTFDYMLGERSWWEGIQLLPPAAHWRVSGDSRQESRYWCFEDIRPSPREEPEVVAELWGLWRQAVHQRVHPGPSPLLLSGGLDSRLVFAELVEQGCQVTPVTFGTAGCRDVVIAARCARMARQRQCVVPITERNWWDARPAAIWQTDGLVNGLHLHVAVALEQMRIGNAWTLKHSTGDVLLGGSGHRLFPTTTGQSAGGKDWIAVRDEFLSQRAYDNPFFSNTEVAEISRGDCDRYLGGPSVDCFILGMGQRRWTLAGPLAMMGYCEVVNPGASLPILQLMLGGLDDRQRTGHRFYARFLCEAYPRFFRTVPWCKTGEGLAEPSLVRAVRRLALRTGFRVGMSRATRNFADYDRLAATARVAERMAGTELVADEVMDGALRAALQRRHEKPIRTRTLLAILTLETYLRRAAGVVSLGD
jgi:asparagine synthase (glutamine-hydrolysing)